MGQFISFLAQGASIGTAATAASAVAAGTFVPLSAAATFGATVMPTILGAAATTAAAGSFLGMSSSTLQGISTVGSMITDVKAGNAESAAYTQQARQEEFAAKDREIARRKRLISSLASQNAYRGASGIRAFEGSPAAMMKSDREEFEYDNLMGNANLSMKTSSLLTSGRYAKQTGYASAGSSLLNYASNRAKRG